jgi:hypothetical protein
MKKIYSIITLLVTVIALAQAPQKMSYQAVIWDGSNNLVTNTQVGMQISILQGSNSGTPVYVETHLPTTNANGLVSVEIGGGTILSGTFSGINWGAGPYFLKTETDPDGATGGLNYTIAGTSQLLSVPYSLFSETSDSSACCNNQWHLPGNANTVDGVNFIGTTDNVPFNIRVNNQKAGRIDHQINNAFFGYAAGNFNTTGFENTVIGSHALYSNTIGQQNTATGAFAMQFNTTGSVNTVTGGGAMNLNTTGSYNCAYGFQTLLFNTTGRHNAANGYLSMNENISGNYNAAHGSYALNSNISGDFNTAVGYTALTNTTLSTGNTALGANAGDYFIDNGDNNTYLGYNTSALVPALTNTTTIGYNAKVAINNAMVLGGTGSDAVSVGVGTTAPHSRAHVNGSFATTITAQSSAYTLGIDDQIVTVTGITTITLPTAVGISGRLYTIKRMDAVNTTTISASGTETIDGVITQTINAQYAGITIASDGANCIITARF